MASEWDVLIILNCYGDASSEYYNVHSEFGVFGDASPKIMGV